MLFQKNNFYLCILLSFSFVSCGYAMEAAEKDKIKIVVPAIVNLHQKLLSCLRLQDDIIGRIVPEIFIVDLYGQQLQTLALVNKCNGQLISDISKDTQTLRKFIKDVSVHLHCSNETITKNLPWKFARQIMFIQNGLFNMCHNPINMYHKGERDKIANADVLERLCQEGGADLDFTHGNDQTTPFMALCASASRCENDDCVRQLKDFFIKKHKEGLIDLNKVNAEGKNGFMISLEDPCTFWVMEGFFLGFFFDYKTLKPFKNVKSDIDLIKINHQDNNGDTALHFYLNGDWYLKNEHIRSFIAAGADPEIKNNIGITPLEQLAQLASTDENFKTAYEYFKQIMERKRSNEKT